MRTDEFLTTLLARGVKLSRRGDRLVVDAPQPPPVSGGPVEAATATALGAFPRPALRAGWGCPPPYFAASSAARKLR